MVDFDRPQSGTIGPGCWFSDLFVAAIGARFTGGLLIRSAGGNRALFFRVGDPVHAGGDGFVDNYLGQVVQDLGLAPPALIIECLQYQEQVPGDARPCLGEILVAKAGVEPADIERAVRAQIHHRFAACFALDQGHFESAPGEDEQLRKVGLPIEGWPVLLEGLTGHGGSPELSATAHLLLGRSVKLKGSLRQLDALMSIPPKTRQGLRYLDKPRKPDQLERALGRRHARGLLRLLSLLDLLETSDGAKAIAIRKPRG